MTWWELVFISCTVVWVFVIFSYVVHIGAAQSGIAALIAAIAPLILPQVQALKLPKGALSAILTTEIFIISAWGGIRLYLDHQPLNAQSNPPTIDREAVPVGGNAKVVFHLSAARDHLQIAFRITDVNGVTQCASETRLIPILLTDGRAQSEMADGQQRRINLHSGVRNIELSLKVANVMNDNNCKVNIFVQHASAYDWSWLSG